jgi:hypothetical protein
VSRKETPPLSYFRGRFAVPVVRLRVLQLTEEEWGFLDDAVSHYHGIAEEGPEDVRVVADRVKMLVRDMLTNDRRVRFMPAERFARLWPGRPYELEPEIAPKVPPKDSGA